MAAGIAGAEPWRGAARPGGPPRTVRSGDGGAAGFEALAIRLRAAPAAESAHLTLAAPGTSLHSGMAVRAYPDFGAYIFRSDRLFLCLRAGFGRHDGSGAHAHVDQLALEVAIDGVD